MTSPISDENTNNLSDQTNPFTSISAVVLLFLCFIFGFCFASKKFRKFCVMVDKARRVDVDGSMKEREWNTEEFHAVLNQHTEEVHSWNYNGLKFKTI